MKPSYPSREWFEEGDNFRDWSTRLNMKFVVQAAQLVLGNDGVSPLLLTDALDRTIAQTAATFLAEGVPAAIVTAFKEQYGSSHYDELLNSVCAHAVEMAPVMRHMAKRKARQEASKAKDREQAKPLGGP